MNDVVVAPKLGIQETKEILASLFLVGKTIKEAKENDGKINLMDAILLVKVVPSINLAIEHGDQAIAEIKDIDEAELHEICAQIGLSVVGLGTPDLVLKITKGLELAKAIAAFVHVL